MDRPWTFAIVITVVSLAPFIFFAVIRYARTNYVWIYKRFQKPVQTTGVIEWVDCVAVPKGGCYYIITYSYTDNMGEQRIVAFRWHERIGWPDDSIVIHFDSQSPERSITDCQLEYGRRKWRDTLIMVVAMIVFAVIGFLCFSK